MPIRRLHIYRQSLVFQAWFQVLTLHNLASPATEQNAKVKHKREGSKVEIGKTRFEVVKPGRSKSKNIVGKNQNLT